MMAEAMKFAVERINNETNYLHGYSLAINKIFDLKKDTKIPASVLATFITDIPFWIGPHSSETSYITGILIGTFRQIAVSYGATYSDFDRTGTKHAYMVRTVPSDGFRIHAVLDIIRSLGWNYLGVINSYGFNGERDALHFIKKFPSAGICLAEQIDLPRYPIKEDYDEAIQTLNKDNRLKVLILFTTNEDSSNILGAIKRLCLKDRFYLFCVFDCTNYIEVIQGKENVASGTISLDLAYREIPEFKDYFLKQTPETNKAKYFRKFWQDLFNCSLSEDYNSNKKACTGKEKLSSGRGYYQLTPVYTVIDAVYAVGKAIRQLVEHYCHINRLKERNSTHCIINASDRKIYSHSAFLTLVNISFIDGTVDRTLTNLKSELRKTDKIVKYNVHSFSFVDGKINHDLIGSWKINRKSIDHYYDHIIQTQKPAFYIKKNLKIFKNKSYVYPHATCSSSCPPFYIKIHDPNPLKSKCCWDCKECPLNSIVKNNTCVKCKYTEMVDKNSHECQQLPQVFINIENNPFAITILCLTGLGICSIFIVTVIFIRFNNTRVIRSSGRDLSYMILVGITVTFSCPFVFLTKPSVAICALRGLLPGVGFLTCYAPLFLKTNRIYRIFLYAKKSVARPPLISPQSQLLVLFGIIAIQILLCCVWFVSKEPDTSFTVSDNRLLLSCRSDASPISIFLNLFLSVMFMISCTVLAFKTRHFPKNYSEAKYIGITLYITCVAWAVFLPAYFLRSQKQIYFIREYLMCAICIVVGYIRFKFY